MLLLPPLLLIEGSYMCHHTQFYVASGDLNSALHACVASTFIFCTIIPDLKV